MQLITAAKNTITIIPVQYKGSIHADCFFQMSEFSQFVICAQKTWHSYTLTQQLEYVKGAHTEM